MRNTVLELLRVERVDPCRTINPKVTQYTITGKTVSDPPERRQIQTINALLASVCKRGVELQQDVFVTWKPDPKYGPQLRKAELDRTKFTHD